MTLYWRGQIHGQCTGNTPLLAIQYSDPDNAPWTAWSIMTGNAGYPNVDYEWNAGGSFSQIQKAGVIPSGEYGAMVSLAITWAHSAVEPPDGSSQFYKNGAPFGSSDFAFAGGGGSETAYIGLNLGDVNATCTAAYIWDRVLTADEIAALDINPYWLGHGGGPPLLAGARVVTIGDSIIEYNHDYTASTELNSQSAGEIVWAQAQSPRFRHQVKFDLTDPLGRNFTGMNHGDAGDTALAMAGRIAAALAMNPAVLIIAAGTNDITASATAVQVQDRLTALYEAGLAANIPVILCTILPRTDWVTPNVTDDPRYAVRNTVNAWINGLSVPGLQIWNPNPDVEDPASRGGLGGHPFAGYMDAGGVHPGSKGGYYGSKTLVPIINSLISFGTIYDYTTNNLLTNPQLAGTAGARNPGTAGLITGPGGGANEIANTWRVSRASGNNAVAVETSKEADGSNAKQVIAYKPGGSSTFENWEFQHFVAASPYFARPVSINDGEFVQGFVTIEVSAWDFWGGYDLYVAGRDGNAADAIVWQTYGLRYMDRTNQNYTSEAQTLTLATVPFVVTSTMTKFQFVVQAYPKMISAGSNGVLKISRPWFGVVPDPATYWS